MTVMCTEYEVDLFGEQMREDSLDLKMMEVFRHPDTVRVKLSSL